MVHELIFAVVVISVAFVPSIVYLVSARNWERYGKEPYWRLLLCFGWGAVAAVIISIILEIAILGNLDQFERIYALGDESFVGAVVVAPVVEEAVKAFGLLLVWGALKRPEDGMVYGISVGLGFAATENLLYELAALESGTVAYLLTVALRTISSTLLHATATALAGLGVGKAAVHGWSFLTIFPYYVGAVVMHALFNFFAGLSQSHPEAFGDWTPCVSILVVIFLALFAWRYAKERIETT